MPDRRAGDSSTPRLATAARSKCGSHPRVLCSITKRLILLHWIDACNEIRPSVQAYAYLNQEGPRRMRRSSHSGSNSAHSPAIDKRLVRHAGDTSHRRISSSSCRSNGGHDGVSALAAETPATIRWSTTDALLQQVKELREDLEGRSQLVVRELVKRFGLDVPITSPFPIDVHVTDQRSNRTIPMPRLR
jgi:hypothetical protein